MVGPEEIMEEALRAKYAAKRRELGLADDQAASGEPRSGTNDPSRPIITRKTLTAECIDCERDFEVEVFAGPSGRGFRVPSRCESCQTIHDEERRRRLEAEEQERLERERKTRLEQLLEMIHQTGANPWDHGHATLDNYDASENGTRPVQAVREFVRAAKEAARYDRVRGLYLFGDTGTGKTHLAVAAVREFLLDPSFSRQDVVFDHALSLITRIQDTYNTGKSTEAILDRRINARVWVLDDLGTEKASDDVVRRLTMIFTERAGRPTLVTSNDAPDRLEDRHPEYFRLQSRLGTAYFRTVGVDGRDRRFDDPTENAA